MLTWWYICIYFKGVTVNLPWNLYFPLNFICWDVIISLLFLSRLLWWGFFPLTVQFYTRTFFTKAKLCVIFWDFKFDFIGNTVSCPNCHILAMTRGIKSLPFWLSEMKLLLPKLSLCYAALSTFMFYHSYLFLFIEKSLSLLDIFFFWNIILMQVWLK